MSNVLELARDALEDGVVGLKQQIAIDALKEAIKQQQNMAEVPELNAMEYWLKCNPPSAGAGYAAVWKAACKWQREAIKTQVEPYGWFDTECNQMFFERHERSQGTEVALYTAAPAFDPTSSPEVNEV